MPSNNDASFIWSVADLLRGSFKAHQYGDIILPFTVLRRLDCVLEPTKHAVLAAAEQAEAQGVPVKAGWLKAHAGHHLSFWNTSRFTLTSTLGDADEVAANLGDYLNGFSENVADIFTKYKMTDRVQELAEAGLLFKVTEKFTESDLSPAAVPNEEMGHIFEELIRRFAEASNETAGEHFTPRDVVRLMVDLRWLEATSSPVRPWGSDARFRHDERVVIETADLDHLRATVDASRERGSGAGFGARRPLSSPR